MFGIGLGSPLWPCQAIDSLDFGPDVSKLDREKAMEAREGFYQTQLKTLERYGGMNTLDSQHILFKSST